MKNKLPVLFESLQFIDDNSNKESVDVVTNGHFNGNSSSIKIIILFLLFFVTSVAVISQTTNKVNVNFSDFKFYTYTKKFDPPFQLSNKNPNDYQLSSFYHVFYDNDIIVWGLFQRHKKSKFKYDEETLIISIIDFKDSKKEPLNFYLSKGTSIKSICKTNDILVVKTFDDSYKNLKNNNYTYFLYKINLYSQQCTQINSIEENSNVMKGFVASSGKSYMIFLNDTIPIVFKPHEGLLICKLKTFETNPTNIYSAFNKELIFYRMVNGFYNGIDKYIESAKDINIKDAKGISLFELLLKQSNSSLVAKMLVRDDLDITLLNTPNINWQQIVDLVPNQGILLNGITNWRVIKKENDKFSAITVDVNGLAKFRGDILNKTTIKGDYTSCIGDIYKGSFTNGQFSGIGEIVYKGGIVVTGNFQNWSLLGNGKITFPDGGSYEGDFANSQYHGKGILNRPSTGQRYEGEFKNGQLHGSGIYWANGQPERCEFYEGKRIDQAYLIRQENRRAELVRKNELLAEQERQRKVQQQMEEEEESAKGAVSFAKALLFATPLVSLKIAGASNKELAQTALSSLQDVYINNDPTMSSTMSTISSFGSNNSQNTSTNTTGSDGQKQFTDAELKAACVTCQSEAMYYTNIQNAETENLQKVMQGGNYESSGRESDEGAYTQLCGNCAQLALLVCQYDSYMRLGALSNAKTLIPNIQRQQKYIKGILIDGKQPIPCDKKCIGLRDRNF